ncbi:hypothetical protein Pcac1_g26738 [Phytophthora cactorum]|nr:hypothetical protein Pcac1_g26738 [Phytophthora cactorum]KAG2793754.1 hypothetical protein PC112_g23309 [Phytophthora cactorum]KAG2873361.1 hypothetical protein PC114_g25901 [Phytophthora cactorum]
MSGDEKVNQVVSQMQRDVATRDGERAAIYVATVRPAMASVRYVHAEHAQQRQDGGKRAGRDNKEQEDGRQAGEGTHQRQSLKPTKRCRCWPNRTYQVLMRWTERITRRTVRQ